MRTRTYATTIEAGRRGGKVIPVPFDPDDAWGSKDRHHVAGSVAGRPIRGEVEAVGPDRWALVVGPSWCRDRAVDPGSSVEVSLWPEGPQFDDLPKELADALAAAPDARRRFEALATFYRKGFVEPIAAAKGPETRERRARQVVEALLEGRQTYR